MGEGKLMVIPVLLLLYFLVHHITEGKHGIVLEVPETVVANEGDTVVFRCSFQENVIRILAVTWSEIESGKEENVYTYTADEEDAPSIPPWRNVKEMQRYSRQGMDLVIVAFTQRDARRKCCEVALQTHTSGSYSDSHATVKHCTDILYTDFPASALECYSDERQLYSGEPVRVKDVLKLTCRYDNVFPVADLTLFPARHRVDVLWKVNGAEATEVDGKYSLELCVDVEIKLSATYVVQAEGNNVIRSFMIPVHYIGPTTSTSPPSTATMTASITSSTTASNVTDEPRTDAIIAPTGHPGYVQYLVKKECKCYSSVVGLLVTVVVGSVIALILATYLIWDILKYGKVSHKKPKGEELVALHDFEVTPATDMDRARERKHAVDKRLQEDIRDRSLTYKTRQAKYQHRDKSPSNERRKWTVDGESRSSSRGSLSDGQGSWYNESGWSSSIDNKSFGRPSFDRKEERPSKDRRRTKNRGPKQLQTPIIYQGPPKDDRRRPIEDRRQTMDVTRPRQDRRRTMDVTNPAEETRPIQDRRRTMDVTTPVKDRRPLEDRRRTMDVTSPMLERSPIEERRPLEDRRRTMDVISPMLERPTVSHQSPNEETRPTSTGSDAEEDKKRSPTARKQ